MSSKTEPLAWTPTTPAQDRTDLTTAMLPPTSTSLPSVPPTGASPSSSSPPAPPSLSAADTSHDHPATPSRASTSTPSLDVYAARHLASTSHIQPTVEFRFTNPHRPAGAVAGVGQTAGSSAASALDERGRTNPATLSKSHAPNFERFRKDSFINQFRLAASGGVIGSAAVIARPFSSANSNPRASTPQQDTGRGHDSKASTWPAASAKKDALRQASSIAGASSTSAVTQNSCLPSPTDVQRDATTRSASPRTPSNSRPSSVAPPVVPEGKQHSENNPPAPSKPKKPLAEDRASLSGSGHGAAPTGNGTSGMSLQKPGAGHRGLERSKEEPKSKRIKTSGGTGGGSGSATEPGRTARPTTAQDNPLAMQAGVMQKLSTQMYNENLEYKRRLEHTERRVRGLEGEKQELKQTFRTKVETALEKYGQAGLAMAQTQKNLQDVAERLNREFDLRELEELRREIQDSLGSELHGAPSLSLVTVFIHALFFGLCLTALQRDYTNPSGSLILERIESTKLEVIRQQQQELKNRDDVISLLREKLEMNTGLLAEANVQRSALETQVGKLEGQVEHLQGVVQGLVSKSEAERAKHCQEVQERDSIIAATTSEKEKLVTELEALQTRHDTVTWQKEELDQSHIQKEDEIKQLATNLHTERMELERLRGVNEGQEREVETLRPLRGEVEEARAELAKHRSQTDQTIQGLRTDLSKLEDLVATKDEEIQSQATTNAKHVERISNLERTVSNLEATNQTAALQAVNLNNTLEASQQHVLALQADLQRQRDTNLSDQLELAASRKNEINLEHELEQVKKARDEASERCATLVTRQEERERQKVDEVMAMMERELAKRDADLASKEGELKRAQNRVGVEERAKQKALLQIAKLKQRPVIENDVGSSPNGSAVKEREGSGEEGGELAGVSSDGRYPVLQVGFVTGRIESQAQYNGDSPTLNALKPPAIPVRASRGSARRAAPAATIASSSRR
ncbi:BZ3500_MvSof-1268-A1-R1_Chr7-1g09465 [Microbotryum saponariae]|uniref:BZ3500_MvSof-1268-A1-R1_Chr7-1g09465 protein n=1 Tax=Microbotryum saponariae TaxID=289078 RepID=A0A2X0L1I1_9BASI|nr:BZ3501_MvSof-1269-A2-R1_Chr7-1g09170 [Microbotryum saponariae]SDA03502.1 BZ3500_MvSof-1268-A1-R1_Chr7-1g09465 [Microbotryum saponariae]